MEKAVEAAALGWATAEVASAIQPAVVEELALAMAAATWGAAAMLVATAEAVVTAAVARLVVPTEEHTEALVGSGVEAMAPG